MRTTTKVLVGVLVTVLAINAIIIVRSINLKIKINKELAEESLDSYIYLATQVKKLKEEVTQVPNKIENAFVERKLNKEQLERKMLKGSVAVYSIRDLGMGSGTVIKKTKDSMYILTCFHVIAAYCKVKDLLPTEKITVGYDGIIYPVDLIKTDEAQDLALLKVHINDPLLEEIKIAINKPKKGDLIYTVGNPMGSMRNISSGIISNYLEIKDEEVLRKFYIVDALCVFGNSGGSLYNENAELVGVPSNVPSYGFGSVVTNMGMCISIDSVREFLKELM